MAAVAALLPGAARATWSVVAVDPRTREVGISGASCIGGVEIIGGLAPGRGAVAAQSFTSLRGRYEAIEMLRRGESPRAIVARLGDPDFDSPFGLPLYELRQYGVAALGFESAPAAYTGSWAIPWRGDAQGRGVSVQGNMLYGGDVVERARAAFEADVPGCRATLADRLVAALEAGAEASGDRRCSREQTALSAFVAVARPDDDERKPTLEIVVPEQESGGDNPVALLRARYDAWRRAHPAEPGACAPPPGPLP